MTDKGSSEPDKYADEQALWNTYRELRKARGVDVDQLYAEWAAEEARKLASPGGREDFDELCKDGCTPQGLAAIIALFRYSARLETIWAMMVGPPENRRKATRALESAAATLEDVFGAIITTEDEKDRVAFAKIGHIPLSRMVAELRSYAKYINLAELLAAGTETHSLAEVSKYFLSSYVKRMTGRFHDRNLSGLIGEITNSPEYNEVAHRMWRGRNYERLEKHHSKLTDFLVAMSVVIARPA